MDQGIREATRDEADLLARLIRDAFRTVADRFGFTPETWPKHAAFTPPERIVQLMDEGFRYFILRQSGRPCGCIALRRISPDPSRPCDARPRAAGRPVEVETVHLRHLAVLPAHRGRGLGQALLEHAIAEARRLGACRMTLGIVADDLPLRHWYERRGFTVTGTESYDGMPCLVTWMAMTL